MKTSRPARRALLACAAVALLAACSSGSQQSSALAPTAPNAAKHGMLPPAPAAKSVSEIHPNLHKSWISPDAKRAPRLLFISDYGGDDVDIFTMPDMALKGTLTGFSSPEGECTDTSGNIWIANTGAQELQQYTRTGTLLQTLSDTGEYPAACAINRANNDMAVANIENSSGGPGNITVFTNSSGTGTVYTNPSIAQYFFVGYDPNGNLFFDGTNESRTSSYFAELPSGSSTTRTISLSGGSLYLAGFIQWYKTGNYIALGDQECNGTVGTSCVYWVVVSGSSGTITATTPLSNYQGGQVCDLVQGVIAGNGERYLAGPDYESCGLTASTAYRWPYEAGGAPTHYNDSAGFVEPIGAAISTK
jgi:hypothetical protein